MAPAMPPPPRTVLRAVDCDAFALVGAANPCPYSSFGDPRRACSYAASDVRRYQKRLTVLGMNKILLTCALDGEQVATVSLRVVRRHEDDSVGDGGGARSRTTFDRKLPKHLT